MNKIFSFITLSVAVFVLAFGLFYIFTLTQKLLLRSYVGGIVSDVAEYSNNVCSFAQGYETWYVLKDDEAKQVFSNQDIRFNSSFFIYSLPQDLKERNPQIAVRGNESSCGILVWSRGFDNISATADDIVPFGEEIPK